MSVVYRAENVRLGNKVALKLLAEALAEDESFRERFVRESRTAASLNHPNIVPIYDAGDSEGVLYIAMRWVDGDLKAHLRREGPMAPDDAIAVAAQVGSALDAAHTRGLLHRDVKPANILLEPGEPGAPPIGYLADFGLTKHLESRSGITASGQFVGTIDYMSPEQIEGREVDARTDIYSLGCVIFESLAGATPFRRETEVAVLWAHMREDPPPLSELRPDLPRELDDVLAKAMAKPPEERYGTCRQLVDDVRAALLGSSVSATRVAGQPGAARTRADDRQRPRRASLLAHTGKFAWVAALIAGLLAGGAAYALFFKPDPQVIPAKGTTLDAQQRLLLGYIPVPLRPACHPTERLTFDFSTSIACTPGGDDVIRVEYNRGESGRSTTRYFEKRAWAEGLAPFGAEPHQRSDCGHPSALAEWRAVGEAGHRPVKPGEEGHGRFLCYRQNGWAAVEWTDSRSDIYSAAYGRDLGRLYSWWMKRAGPIPPD
jgi:Protein kinase domain